MDKDLTAGLRRVHPGEVLREDVIPALGRPKVEIARMLGISRQTLYDLLTERQPMTAALALRLGKLLGTSPESWVRMQQEFDLKGMGLLAKELETDLAEIPTLEVA